MNTATKEFESEDGWRVLQILKINAWNQAECLEEFCGSSSLPLELPLLSSAQVLREVGMLPEQETPVTMDSSESSDTSMTDSDLSSETEPSVEGGGPSTDQVPGNPPSRKSRPRKGKEVRDELPERPSDGVSDTDCGREELQEEVDAE